MLFLSLFVVMAGPPVMALAPGPTLEERADALVQEGKLDEAFELLEQAYYAQPEPEPRLLFGMGVIALERGECEEAVGYLGRFLATSPAEEAAAKAREVIAYCEEELRAQAESVADPEPAVGMEPTRGPDPSAGSEPVVAPAPGGSRITPSRSSDTKDTPPPPRDEWFRDGLGWGLLGTGVAVTAVGTGLLVQAQGDVRAAEASSDEANFDRNLERVGPLRVVGGTLTGVGVGLLVGAAIRYGLVARRGRRSDAARATAGSWLRTTIRF